MNKIAVFSKKPEPGKTKTRLVPLLTSDEAKELSEAFLKDTLKLIDGLDFINQKIIYFYPPRSAEYFKSITDDVIRTLNRNSLSSSSWLLKIQEGKDLGGKLSNAIFAELSVSGKKPTKRDEIEKFIIIGSDSPTIPEKYIKEAFLILEKEEIVLGPAKDGGFYLIGIKNIWPGIFESVRWSSNHTLNDVILNLEKLSLKFKQLPEWYDIDEIIDIRKLTEDIKKIPDSYCSNTRIFLNKLDKKIKIIIKTL